MGQVKGPGGPVLTVRSTPPGRGNVHFLDSGPWSKRGEGRGGERGVGWMPGKEAGGVFLGGWWTVAGGLNLGSSLSLEFDGFGWTTLPGRRFDPDPETES